MDLTVAPNEFTDSKVSENIGLLSKIRDSTSGLIISPPLSLIMPPDSRKRKGVVGKILNLVSGFRPGVDLTRVKIPPYFNMPKSVLQIYGESVYCCNQDLLGACADAKSPVDRFLAVVRWHISLMRPTPFARAPYNPVLGETHHVSSGDLHVVLEQVSHKPPKFAAYAINPEKDIHLNMHNHLVPWFYGSWIEIEARGIGKLQLGQHGEEYSLTPPRLSFRLMPVPGTEWIGTTSVKCKQTGLEAEVQFLAKPMFGLRGQSNRVSGRILESRSGKVLFEIKGHWDKSVRVYNKETGKDYNLYDARAAIEQLNTPIITDEKGLALTESVRIWSKLTRALLEEKWGTARSAKSEVEEMQRAERRRREERGEDWLPQFFKPAADGSWTWAGDNAFDFKQPAPIQAFPR